MGAPMASFTPILNCNLKKINDVELVFPSDEFQTFWIFIVFTCSYSIPEYLWPTWSWGLNIKSSDTFGFILLLKRPVLFCRKWKLLSLQDSTGGTVGKWKIFNISITFCFAPHWSALKGIVAMCGTWWWYCTFWIHQLQDGDWHFGENPGDN